ncbi:MAG: hypothetical protein ACR2M7_03880 [Bdellovibrionales bacterium]
MKFLILFFFSLPCFAKVHIEPYVGYGFTIMSQDQITKDLVNDIGESIDFFIDGKKYENKVAGIRLGYRSIGLGLGVDLSIAQWAAISGSETLTPITSGLFASYNLPLLFRVYGVFIPMARVFAGTLEENSTASDICDQSHGIKAGLSYLSIPFLSINFEYQSLYIGGDSQICGSWANSGSVYLNFMF